MTHLLTLDCFGQSGHTKAAFPKGQTSGPRVAGRVGLLPIKLQAGGEKVLFQPYRVQPGPGQTAGGGGGPGFHDGTP